MATVVNTFPDRRAEILGKGLGALVGNVLAARQKKEEEKKRKEALARAADLTKEIAQGSQVVDESDVAEALFDAGLSTDRIATSFEAIARARIAKRQRAEDEAARQAAELRGETRDIRGEGRAQQRTLGAEQRAQTRRISTEQRQEGRTKAAEGRGEARAVRREGREEDREEGRFTRALRESKQVEIKKGVDERLEQIELGEVLQEAATGELDARQMFGVIAEANLPAGIKFGLLDRMAKGELGVDVAEAGFVDLDVFDIESGRKTKISVPEDIARGSRQQQEVFFKEKGFDVTTQPGPSITGEERVLEMMFDAAGGEDDEFAKKLVLNRKSGLITVDADNQGNMVITDLVSRKTSFIPNPIMDAVAARQVQFRIASIEDALTSLDGIDLTKVGLEDFLTAKIAGGAVTIPVLGGLIGTVLDLFGLEPSEIAEAQAARAGFFATLAPIAKSIATEEGERNAISSPAAIELAESIVLITNVTTTEMGARIAVDRLKKTLQNLKVKLMAQLSHRSMLRPTIIDVDISQDAEGGRVKINRRSPE